MRPPADPRVLALGVPVLGICYGLQFIVHHLGGKVRSADQREYGHADVDIESAQTALFAGLAGRPAGLDVPRRRGARACPPASRYREDIERRGRHRQRIRAASGRCSFIPKCTTRRRARSC